MKNRRGFLTVLGALSSAAVATVMAAKSDVGPVAAADAPVKPGKAPSAAALAFAATYRAFDAHLTDADLQTIAHGIDDNRAAATKLSPKAKPLRNSDEMVVHFAAAQSVRR